MLNLIMGFIKAELPLEINVVLVLIGQCGLFQATDIIDFLGVLFYLDGFKLGVLIQLLQPKFLSFPTIPVKLNWGCY